MATAKMQLQKTKDVPHWMPTVPPLRMPRSEDIVEIISAWAIATYPKIQAIYHQKGGWEGWAQVELAYVFTQQYPEINCFREQQVYAGTERRADMVLTHPDQVTMVIELKTESLFQDTSIGVSAAVNAIYTDINKIDRYQISDPFRQPNGATPLAIGFTLNDQVNLYACQAGSWGTYAPFIIPSVMDPDKPPTPIVPETHDVPALFMWRVEGPRQAPSGSSMLLTPLSAVRTFLVDYLKGAVRNGVELVEPKG
jgi:hypothetical protein